jgi:alpha-glucoside transport system substrate-binding protein
MQTFIDGGEVVPLDFLDMDRMKQQFGDVWLNLGTINGKLYPIFVRTSVKSLIWYNKPAFEAAGYEIPKTWDDLLALCDQIVGDGSACFSIGLESGAASGWPATDWIEDIMLRTAGLDTYDAWVNHTISWTSPEVTNAWKTFGQIVGNPDYQFGGSAGTLATNFGDAPCPLFTDPPGAYLHWQASFIQSFIMSCPGGDKLVPGDDFDFFAFPQIDPMYGNPIEGAADSFILFTDNENTRALIDFLTQPDTMAGWLKGGGSGRAICNAVPYACVYAIEDVEKKAIDSAVSGGQLLQGLADDLKTGLRDAVVAYATKGERPAGEGWQTVDQWDSIIAGVNSVNVRAVNSSLDTGIQPIDWIRQPHVSGNVQR